MSSDNDYLMRMWEQQHEFMKLLQQHRSFPQYPVDPSTREGQRFVKEKAHDCMHELFEAIHLLKNSKSHRKSFVGDFDQEKFLEELADTLHYFVEVCILLDLDAFHVFEAYMKKGEINTKRILEGY